MEPALKTIQPPKCFPCCVVWTPLPVLAWLFPLIGHAGIGLSDGTILDFAGPYFVNDQGLAFGNPTMYMQLDLHKALELCNIEDTKEKLQAYDKALDRGAYVYKGQMYYIWNNCYQFVSHCLNIMGYKGRRDWNMVRLAVELFFHARFLTASAFLRSCGPFLLGLSLAIYFGGIVALTTWLSFIGVLLSVIFIYSFIVYDPKHLQLMTPNNLDTSRQ
mmetsp:Transcript_7576/g.10237  ORF Transcript_7576/g.10237 Transcript_7576/m.10237 type:complete len:217 (+) Transcript_7576:254-904(+)